jgi:crotonobetainyl-CoA:carnitine CoA-transferase CaiB-like acyl-CoA transferase
MLHRTRAEWEQLLDDADVPHGPILDVAEAIAQDQVRARGVVQTMAHPTAGKVEVIGSPIRASGADREPPGPSPLLGEHTREILTTVLGYDDHTVSRLVADGVVEHPPSQGGRP